jgi:hypothetical protein
MEVYPSRLVARIGAATSVRAFILNLRRAATLEEIRLVFSFAAGTQAMPPALPSTAATYRAATNGFGQGLPCALPFFSLLMFCENPGDGAGLSSPWCCIARTTCGVV